MKLLENNLTQILIDQYDFSIGYLNGEKNLENYSGGIKYTFPLTPINIKHVKYVELWDKDIEIKQGQYYQYDNKVYISLYTPNTKQTIPPTGNLLTNIILDDNYVWRYIADVDYTYNNNYITFKDYNEVIKMGCIAYITLIEKSEFQLNKFKNQFVLTQYMSGTNLSYSLEGDQETDIITDVLIQSGGQNYHESDLFVMTDTSMNATDIASVDLEITDGKLSVKAFTNGQNYTYMDIIIVGDGQDATVNFSSVAGVLTNVTMSNTGKNYTWAKAIVLNSEKYIIGKINLEPLNGYNSNFYADKYLIEYETNKVTEEINYYGLHKKVTDQRYKEFEVIAPVDSFTPIDNETIKLQIILG